MKHMEERFKNMNNRARSFTEDGVNSRRKYKRPGGEVIFKEKISYNFLTLLEDTSV